MESAATHAVAVVVSALLGLVVGSFLNVVIYRLPRHESIAHPPSHCPTCGTQLGAVENIPVVSWIALRGRCRHCAAPISARYPLVELLTGVLFVGTALAAPTWEPLAPLDAVLASTVAIGAIGLDEEPVPEILGWIALGASVSLTAVSLSAHHPGRLVGAVLGAAVAVAAWLLLLVGPLRGDRARFPGIAAWAAWGWAAGWADETGGVVLGIALVVLVLLASVRPLVARRLTGAAAGAAIAAIVIGMVAAR